MVGGGKRSAAFSTIVFTVRLSSTGLPSTATKNDKLGPNQSIVFLIISIQAMKKTKVQSIKTWRNKRKVATDIKVVLHKFYSTLIADAISSILILLHGIFIVL